MMNYIDTHSLSFHSPRDTQTSGLSHYLMPLYKNQAEIQGISCLEDKKLQTVAQQSLDVTDEIKLLHSRSNPQRKYKTSNYGENAQHQIVKKIKPDNIERWRENFVIQKSSSNGQEVLNASAVQSQQQNTVSENSANLSSLVLNQPQMVFNGQRETGIQGKLNYDNDFKLSESFENLQTITDSLCANSTPLFDFVNFHEQYCLAQTSISKHGSLEAYLQHQQMKFDNFMLKMQDILETCTTLPGDVESETEDNELNSSNITNIRRTQNTTNKKKTKKTKKNTRHLG